MRAPWMYKTSSRGRGSELHSSQVVVWRWLRQNDVKRVLWFVIHKTGNLNSRHHAMLRASLWEMCNLVLDCVDRKILRVQLDFSFSLIVLISNQFFNKLTIIVIPKFSKCRTTAKSKWRHSVWNTTINVIFTFSWRYGRIFSEKMVNVCTRARCAMSWPAACLVNRLGMRWLLFSVFRDHRSFLSGMVK